MRSAGRVIVALVGALTVASCGGDDSDDDAPPPPPAPVKTRSVVLGDGLEPDKVAVAPGGRVWVADNEKLASVDAMTRKLATDPRPIGSGSRLYDLAAGDAGVWTVAKDGRKVTVALVDPRTGRTGKPVTLADYTGFALRAGETYKAAVGSGRMWTAHQNDSNVAIVDPETGGAALAAAESVEDVAAGGGYGWAVNEEDEPGSSGGTLDRIDPRTRKTDVVELGDTPTAVTYGAGATWVLFKSSVARYDARGRKTATIGLPGVDASNGYIAAGGNTVWALALDQRRLVRIDARSNKPIGAPLRLPATEPLDLAATADSAWIALKGDPLLRIGPG